MSRAVHVLRASVAVIALALLAAGPARAQATCAAAGAQINRDADLARDCAAGVCVERVCVDTVYRRATAAPAIRRASQTLGSASELVPS